MKVRFKSLFMAVTLLGALTQSSAQAQSLAAYDAAFPKAGSKNAQLINAAISYSIALFIAGFTISVTRTAEKDLWLGVLPEETKKIDELTQHYKKIKHEVRILSGQSNPEVTDGVSLLNKEKDLKEAALELQKAEAVYHYHQNRFLQKKMTEFGSAPLPEGNPLALATKNRISVFRWISGTVTILFAYNATTRAYVAFQEREPGMFPDATFIGLGMDQLRNRLGL